MSYYYLRMMTTQPDAPIVASQPLTITVDTPVQMYDSTTGHYYTVFKPQTIANPALDCHRSQSVSGTALALCIVLAVVITWIARGLYDDRK